MISDADLKEIETKPPTCAPSPEHVHTGVPIPKVMRVRLFSPDAWEEFIEEWANSLKSNYVKVRRFGGSGDLGVDIAGFCSNKGFEGEWDNYQCKRYDHPLRPNDIWVEIGKIIYYSHIGEYAPPRRHYFVCSQDIGTSLEKLLNKPTDLQAKAAENWDKHCLNGITSTMSIPLVGALADHFNSFDFSVFSSRSLVELIEGHSKTGFHAVRFGGGLPPRPGSALPPETPADNESRYIRQLLDAYGDHLGIGLADPLALDPHTKLKRDYLRQRERFYHAESLRNFARDTVPEGTFDALQDEIHSGVIDVCEGSYADGFERMKATVAQASSVAATSNPLVSAVKAQDRQGICHQLANDDRLNWMPQG
ncbi:restriction endonuclease [Mesorhizobium sp. WSM4303]|uniref:ABC-three component system protein n=1 Tax=unclassified Mesorhizobium TaxID=325217 RepID=UPI00115DFD4A|nr:MULTISPECIES: ABC-three component system protein [unclassified Mesorhizobium]TRD00142.1 restriction endonuclease [Mesorhizobium sp. WSM4303]TRD00294.1 restriction endonuclease [Mesorhizobium sp. WSM4306]